MSSVLQMFWKNGYIFIGLRLDTPKIPSQARGRGPAAAWLPVLVQKLAVWHFAISPSSMSVPVLLLLNLFHTGVDFCLYAWGKVHWGKWDGQNCTSGKKTPLVFSPSSFFVSFKTIASWETKEEWRTKRRRVLSCLLSCFPSLFRAVFHTQFYI